MSTLRQGRTLGLAVALGLAPAGAMGQGVQALRGVGEVAKQRDVDSAVVIVKKRMAAYDRLGTFAACTPETVGAALRATAAGEDALLVRNEPDRFRDRLPAFVAADHQVRAIEYAERSALLRATAKLNEPCDKLKEAPAIATSGGNLPIPAIGTLVPQVAFTAAYGGSFGSGRYVTGIGFNTNMAGAAIGSAFDALGSGSLKEYFTNNVAMGVSIPTSGVAKVSSDLGLGLGAVSVGEWAAWPVLGLAELDSVDARLAPELAQRRAGQATWSQLTFGVGVPFRGQTWAVKRMKCGKLAPILVAGVRLPHYFPGTPFDALGAVFTSRKKEYERAGGASLLVAVDVPMLKVSQPADDKAKEECAKV